MKIVFLQNKGKSYGGVCQVNKIVGEALIKDGYDVSIISIRENHNDYKDDYNPKLHVKTLNTQDDWETYNYSEVINELKKFHLITALKKLKHRLHNNKTLKIDAIKLKEYLDKEKPDYIVNSHYQVLDMIPAEYLKITYHEHHTDFNDALKKDNWKTLQRYNNRVKFIWLCEATMAKAIEHGLNNNYYIYNAVRFENNEVNNVLEHKKLVTVARICEQKRIDKMVNIANKLFSDSKYKDWKLEIYGDGPLEDVVKKLIKSDQIHMMGRTNDVEEVLMNSSINLITSDYEGFCLTIVEGYECYLPVVSLDFREPTKEVIEDGVSGFIAKDEEDFLIKLKELIDNPELLKKMSLDAKKYNEKFHINKIVKEWEKLFK